MALFVIFFSFRLLKFSKIFIVQPLRRNTNFKHEKSWICTGGSLEFCKIVSFYVLDVPKKRATNKIKYLSKVCQMIRTFTKRNSRKFTVSFAFCAHVLTLKSC